MAEPHNKPESAQHDEEFDRFDEAQPFLQLLADMLTRISGEPETDDVEEEVNQQEQAAGSLLYPIAGPHNWDVEAKPSSVNC